MSYNSASAVVGKLLKETQEGKIKWIISYEKSSDVQQDDDTKLIGNIYTALVETKNIRLYRYKTRVTINSKYYYSYASLTNNDAPKWIDLYKLELYNTTTNRSEWVFPDTNATRDLYEAVCTQISGINDFLSLYLNKDQ